MKTNAVSGLSCLALLVILVRPSVAISAKSCTPISDFEGEPSQLFIGDVTIKTDDVFDESNDRENRRLHKVTNKLHVNTLPGVIRRQLIFKTGDPYQHSTLTENERLLRANRYIRLAKIKPVEVCDKLVAIEVTTSDNWTFTPGISYGRSGGYNESSVEVKDSNLFGRGKTLQLKIAQKVDRDERILHYFDPQLLGSLNQLDLKIHSNSDGYLNAFSMTQPFAALKTGHSWQATLREEDRIDPFYRSGQVVRNFRVTESVLGFSASRAIVLSESSVFRFGLGFQFINSSVTNTGDNGSAVIDRSVSGPLVKLEYLQSNYITQHNLRQFNSIEDVSLGHRATLQFGWSSSAFGASERSVPFSASYKKGFRLHESVLAFVALAAKGSYRKSAGLVNSTLDANASVYMRQSDRFSLLVKGNVGVGHELYEHRQLTLGGDNGLRGYPLSFQSGDSTVLFTIEQRVYFDWYPFALVRFGGALFADVGTSWGATGGRHDTLRDIGMGLRIVPTRHSKKGVIHMDLAVPLDDNDGISGVQLLIKTKSEF